MVRKPHLFLPLIIGVSAYGNSTFSIEKNKTSQIDVDAAKSGLQIVIKNSLPAEQIEKDNIKIIHHLNAYFCSPIPTENIPIPNMEERCIRLNGMIENGKSETFLVSKADLARMEKQGRGKGSFEFNDNNAFSSIPWHCYPPNDTISIDSDFSRKQVWNVEINQRNTLSYSCLIQKLP